MKFVGGFVFAVLVAAAAGAAIYPLDWSQEQSLANQYQEYQQRFLRDKRSGYPGAYYTPAPCGALAAPIPAPHFIAPIHHKAPVFAPAVPQFGGFGYPAPLHYREAEEMMNFSDMDQMEPAMSQSAMFEQSPQFEHVPMARYSYGPAPAALQAIPALAPPYSAVSSASAAAALAGIHAAPASAAPTIGVFPNANTGGCSVPLLLSCSPSIKSGHMMKSHAGYGGDSYRGVDEQQAGEGHEDLAHEQLAPAHDVTPTSAPLHQ